MSALLEAILANKPVRTPLEFGINENVRLVSINNDTRTYEGEVIKRNTFMTFARFNSEGKKIAASEFSYFNLDHTSQHVCENLVQQTAQLNDICKFFGVEGCVDPTTGFESMEDLVAELSTKSGCAELMSRMWTQFNDLVGDLVGENSPVGRLKVVVSNKGHLQLPRESHIIESIESNSTLSISPYELKLHQTSLQAPKEEADAKGDAPTEKATTKNALKNL